MTDCPYCKKQVHLFDEYRFTKDSPIHSECYKKWEKDLTYCSHCKENTHDIFGDGWDEGICSHCGHKKEPEDLKKTQP